MINILPIVGESVYEVIDYYTVKKVIVTRSNIELIYHAWNVLYFNTRNEAERKAHEICNAKYDQVLDEIILP